MLFEDKCKLPIKESESRFNSRGSKFYGFLFPVDNEEEVKRHLDEIKNKFPDATHWCYAYILNIDKSIQKFSDDGEPSNTAGRPILRQILSKEITNVLIIVVRYFGGKLLGVPGLIEAYGETARLALEETSITEKLIESYYKVEYNYEDEAQIWQLARMTNARIEEQIYDQKGCIIMAVLASKGSDFEKQAKEFFKLEWSFWKTA